MPSQTHVRLQSTSKLTLVWVDPNDRSEWSEQDVTTGKTIEVILLSRKPHPHLAGVELWHIRDSEDGTETQAEVGPGWFQALP